MLALLGATMAFAADLPPSVPIKSLDDFSAALTCYKMGFTYIAPTTPMDYVCIRDAMEAALHPRSTAIKDFIVHTIERRKQELKKGEPAR